MERGVDGRGRFQAPSPETVDGSTGSIRSPSASARTIVSGTDIAGRDPRRVGRYPYQFICFRITDYRPDSYPDLLIAGSDLVHDLTLFIESLGGRSRRSRAEQWLTLEDQQAIERLDQDDPPLAQAGAGRPAGRLQRQDADGLHPVGGGPLPGGAPDRVERGAASFRR